MKNSCYIDYFESGKYDQRYPSPNLRTLEMILRYAVNADTILDYGCGNGRYTIPLLQNSSARIYVYDKCKMALMQLSERAQKLNLDDRIVYLNSEEEVMNKYRYDAIISIFGVLSHISSHDKKRALLKCFYRRLRKNGALIISVPNANRRFLIRQINWLFSKKKIMQNRPNSRCEITYTRRINNKRSLFHYNLYTVDELLSEIQYAQFKTIQTTCESIIPESLVVKSRVCSRLDGYFSSLLPSKLGYGILLTALKEEHD